MNRFSKTHTTAYFEKWDAMKDRIEKLYGEKDKEAIKLMVIAINDYADLLEYGGEELNEQTGKRVPILLPLNGLERFDFIKDRIQSHYAHIQLNALYDETKKKAARLSVMKR